MRIRILDTDARIGLDSGAYSHWNSMLRKSALERGGKVDKKVTASFRKSKEFTKYLDSYIEFLKHNQDKISWYASLDVVGDEEASLDVFREMKNSGLSPVPVFHINEKFSVLKAYADTEEYIAIGGRPKSVSPRRYREFVHQCFNMVSSNTKIHGFGVTGRDLLMRFPFFSVDSSTWLVNSSMGSILLPTWTNNGLDYLHINRVFVTDEVLASGGMRSITSSSRKLRQFHIKALPVGIRNVVLQYLELGGITLEEFSSSYKLRAARNFSFYSGVQRCLQEHYQRKFGKPEGWGNVYIAAPSYSYRESIELGLQIRNSMGFGADPLYLLPTFFYKRDASYIIDRFQSNRRNGHE